MGLRLILTLLVVSGLPFVIRKVKEKWITCILLVIYIIFVLVITLGSRGVSVETHISWNPCHVYSLVVETVVDGVQKYGLKEVWKRVLWYKGPLSSIALNILLFVPLGYLVPCVFFALRNWWLKGALVGFCFSLMIETTQLITHLGWFDTSDLLHNTIGAIIGYGFFVKWLKEKTMK